jgi:hypothetical protein
MQVTDQLRPGLDLAVVRFALGFDDEDAGTMPGELEFEGRVAAALQRADLGGVDVEVRHLGHHEISAEDVMEDEVDQGRVLAEHLMK